MKTLLDPKTLSEFLVLRKANNRLRANKTEETRVYLDLSEKSGIPVTTLKEASYGKNENNQDAFMQVASSDRLSNKEKNLVLSGAVGKKLKEISVKLNPTHTITKTWKTPVRATICSPIEGYTSHKKCITVGGGQRVKETIKKAKPTKVDFSDVTPTTSYSDIFLSESKSSTPRLLEVAPISTMLILALIPPSQNKFIALNSIEQSNNYGSGGTLNYFNFFK